jgi:hypothetical protein
VERVDNSRSTRTGDADEIVAETEKVVQMDDIGSELLEDALKGLPKKCVRPRCDSCVLGSIDAVVGGEAGVRCARQATTPTVRSIRDVKDADIIRLAKLLGQVEAVDLRSLR